MKRSFVRILWGDFLQEDLPSLPDLEKEYGFKFDKENKILIRRFKIDNDIKKCMEQKFIEPFAVYTFGEKNHKQLIDMGIKSVLIHKEPYKYHPIRGVYKHKIYAHQYIMNDFDEVVFLDWDTYLTKPLPVDFWERMGKKEIFQASLGKYRTPRINHRKDIQENRLIPTGAFVYMRDKSIPERLVKYNEGANAWSCEPAFARLTDEMTGGWKGIEKYWELFEPEFYTCKTSPYKFLKDFTKPNLCFGNGWGD
jgi:hypothetical protein